MAEQPAVDLTQKYPTFDRISVALYLAAGFGLPVPLAAHNAAVTIVYGVVATAAAACLLTWEFIRRRHNKRAADNSGRNLP